MKCSGPPQPCTNMVETGTQSQNSFCRAPYLCSASYPQLLPTGRNEQKAEKTICHSYSSFALHGKCSPLSHLLTDFFYFCIYFFFFKTGLHMYAAFSKVITCFLFLWLLSAWITLISKC